MLMIMIKMIVMTRKMCVFIHCSCLSRLLKPSPSLPLNSYSFTVAVVICFSTDFQILYKRCNERLTFCLKLTTNEGTNVDHHQLMNTHTIKVNYEVYHMYIYVLREKKDLMWGDNLLLLLLLLLPLLFNLVKATFKQTMKA